MATYTSYLNLEKPAVGETFNLLKINQNWDKIDQGVSALNSNLSTKANLAKTGWGTRLSVPANQTQVIVDANIKIQVWLGGSEGISVWVERSYFSDSNMLSYMKNSTSNTITFGVDGADGTDFTITRSGSTFVLTTATSHTMQAFY